MSTQNSSFSVDGGDLPVTNYTNADIPAGLAVQLDTTAGNYLGVVPLAASAKAFGVTLDLIKAGRPGRLRALGSAIMTADGAIVAGDIVKGGVTATKEGRAKVTVAADAQLGRALTNAADGGEVLVWIAPAKNA